MKKIIAIIILIIFVGCSKELPLESNNSYLPQIPEKLEDEIPYDKIGKGKIAFERIGPFENNYSGLVVIDSKNKSALTFQGLYQTPVISPNGQNIFFRSYDYNEFDLKLLNLNSKKLTSVDDGQYPNWSADGAYLLYINIPEILFHFIKTDFSDFSKSSELYLSSYDFPWSPYSINSNEQIIFGSSSLILLDKDRKKHKLYTSETGIIYNPRWSPDNKFIAFAERKKRTENEKEIIEEQIIVLDIATNEVNVICKWDLADHIDWAGTYELSVCWSPDGEYIAFNKNKTGTESHIYVIDKNGNNLTQITNAPGVSDTSVSWSKE
ncbi:MAG: PD40 domain-containing protein [Ignavibacteriae bacterium]|nr:PD40 domain-containing protein [Ignavibacteriota bacterium]